MRRVAESIEVDISTEGRWAETCYGSTAQRSRSPMHCYNVTIRLRDADPTFVDQLMAWMQAQGAQVREGYSRPWEPPPDVDPEFADKIRREMTPSETVPLLGSGGVVFEDDDEDPDPR
jgi:hypothetical protein